MPYTKSLDEIIDYLYTHPGIVIRHRDRGQLKVLSVDKEAKTAQIWAADKKTGEFVEKPWDLKVLFGPDEWIEPDGVFIFKTKTIETSQPHIKKPEKEVTPPPSTTVSKPKSVYGLSDFLAISKKEETNIWQNATENLTKHEGLHFENHSELANAMDKGAEAVNCSGYSGHFWHITQMKNAIAIINSGYFKSRDALKGRIPFDNVAYCPPTTSVMDSNYSDLIKGYCRFYLRPCFSFTYAYLKNAKARSFVQFSVSRDRIFNYLKNYWIKEAALMLSYNAHYATSDELSWRNQINSERKLKEKDFSGFHWENIYRWFEPSLSPEIKAQQFAEFIIADRLSCDFIDGVYFSNRSDMEFFLSSVNPEARTKLSKKCFVKAIYFMGVEK